MSARPRNELVQEYRTITRTRRANTVPVTQPMAMITQAPRSGGTMLMHLLDGHPQCHVFPVEFRIRFGRPVGPGLDEAWAQLNDPDYARQFRNGVPHGRRELHGDKTRHPLLLPPLFHRQLFDELAQEASGERELVNAYLTSFFNAWLDNQNLYGVERKDWVVAFTPRLIANQPKLAHFRRIYPDARLISLIRDPLTWFCSARRWSDRLEWTELRSAIDFWSDAASATLDCKEAEGDGLLVLAFDDVITRTAATMALVADHLGIRYHDGLTKPTFNRLPVKANSSFSAGKARVNPEPLERADELTPDETRLIREQAWDLYEQVLAGATRPAETPAGKTKEPSRG